ncbi:MAG TPA: flavin reductase family protein [Rhizomicrobium sp.]|nr:flavin reductase family protein [Rhizomicrobium sp.]
MPASDTDQTFDTRAFRDALGQFPTGVAVVTAMVAGRRSANADQSESDLSHIGITVNSFAAVSLDPPLVLWCIDRRSRRHDAFVAAPGFTVSILSAEHKAVSARLSGAGEHTLDGLALLATELGPPALADSLAVFECARESVVPGGDHSILIGRVLRLRRPQEGAPLVFFQGRYSALA